MALDPVLTPYHLRPFLGYRVCRTFVNGLELYFIEYPD